MMLNTTDKIIKHKVGLLNLAQELGNGEIGGGSGGANAPSATVAVPEPKVQTRQGNLSRRRPAPPEGTAAHLVFVCARAGFGAAVSGAAAGAVVALLSGGALAPAIALGATAGALAVAILF